MSKLLIEEYPLVVLPQLAAVIGLNEAIVLQQIHYWVDLFKQAKDKHHYQEGKWWVWNTGTEWQENFPFWSECTVRRVLESLRNPYKPKKETDKKVAREPLIIVGKFNKKGYDQTLWYRINYQEVDRIEASLAECVNGPAQVAEKDISNVSKPIPETTSEINTEKLAAVAVGISSEKPLTKQEESGIIWDITEPHKVVCYPEDVQFRCPNPYCDEEVQWASLKKNRAICPVCGQYIDGYEYGANTPIYKAPKARAKTKTVGDLVPKCPEKIANIMYYAVDKQVAQLLIAHNREMFLDCMNWAVNKMSQGSIPPNKVTKRAIAWMQKRVAAEPNQESSTTIEDAVKGTGYTPEEMERIIAWRKTQN